jgi:hypothetical protein
MIVAPSLTDAWPASTAALDPSAMNAIAYGERAFLRDHILVSVRATGAGID